MPKLTKRAIDALSSKDTEYVIWDSELRGFGIRVWPSGKKTYALKCRLKGKQKKYTIGTHGTLTVDQARTKTIGILSQVKHGIDPSEELRAHKKALTIADLGKKFLEEYVPTHCKASTAYEYKRSVEHFINGALGKYKIMDVARPDVAAMHHNLHHIPYQANRTLGVLSKMMNLAEIWGLRQDGSNPCRHVKKYPEKGRERFLSKEEFIRLAEVLDEVEASGEETHSCINAYRLLMYTGCRLGEIQKLEWAHADFEANELHLPDSKTGAKTVYLGDAAVEVLKNIERQEGNPYVIRGKLEGSYLTDLQHPWRRIRAKAGLANVRIHDLRHSFASNAIALGMSLPMVGKLLGHTQIQTTARYAHLASDPIKEAANLVAQSIAQSTSAT
ncbi:site-specific integrase [Paremcibacter congregatus]|uniref:Integrase n=1 Tax=Paremcibacter congregatus TaxID=2043170 RepID=A0A2G4YWN7_9PROT|nr:site-specific integrase [Paremcibacter congregatus]PHZ86754.1 integrase [Paremcibacter congregatus]QDE26293.1 site-specific integrase [Paremcibacter congregatus]QDE28000.1 site-specific integrase [Paremcibacter congregatus]